MKIAVVTDSNSGITQNEAKQMGIFVVPMPFLINGEQYFEDVNLTQDEFYDKLTSDATVSTSQPSAFDTGEIWTKVLKDYDQIIHIPMSSGLSQTCRTLTHLAETEFKGKVFVVNNQRISVTQRQSVEDALKMIEEGKTAEEICEELLRTKMFASIYIMVDTLKYLKKGGRLTPAAALIGTLLKIKPVLQIQGEKLDTFTKVRKVVDAKKAMIAALKHDLQTRFKDLYEQGKMYMAIAHTQNLKEAEIFKEELMAEIPDVEFKCINPLSLSVACHTGPGVLASGVVFKY